MKKTLITILLAIALCGTASAAKKTKATATEPVKQTAPITIVDALAKLSGNLLADVKGKPTFAFIALTSDDGNALVENYVTDALTEAMFKTGKIKVVERASIEKIMTEQQFQSSAIVNENTAVEIGNLSGANYVCYGTVKDLGDQLTINVKVVEVSTAELCSMGRDTVDKDKYLQGVGFEKRKITTPVATSNEQVVKNSGNVVSNNQWKIQSFRNDFYEYTQYTFWVKGADNDYFVVGIKKCDAPFNSRACAGIHWNKTENLTYCNNYKFEFKEGNGNKTAMDSNGYWKWNYSEKSYIYIVSRYLEVPVWKTTFKMLLSNDTITVRADNRVVKFQTAGLEEKIIEAGLTVQDFYDAFANEEF